MRHWWSGKPELIKVQIWVVLILSPVLLALRQRVAKLAEVDLFEVSLPLLIEQLPHLRLGPQPLLTPLLEQGRHLGILRPSTRLRVQAPELPLEDYLPAPADLQWQRTPHYRVSSPRSAPSGYSGYQAQRARAQASKQARAQRPAKAQASKTAKPVPDSA